MRLLLTISFAVFSLQQVVSETLTDSLVSLVNDAFHRTIRALYLVDVEKRNLLERFLTLPYPKVVFDGHTTVGRLDESCLVVLFVVMTNVTSSLSSLRKTFSNIGGTPWNARVLALVDEPYLQDGTAVLLLEQWFRHCAISYWSATSASTGTSLQYSLDYGNQFITVNGPLVFEDAYSYRRMFINYYVRVYAQALVSFPYTYISRRNAFGGIDYMLFGYLFYYLKLDARLVDVEGSTTEQMLHSAIGKLAQSKVDLMITRRVIDATHLPRIVIPELITFCLVVPRKLKLIFFNSLFQPFASDLWTFIACITVSLYGITFLTESSSTIGNIYRRTIHNGYLLCFGQIILNFIKFVLIESYLARVTSLLLVYRYEQEPQTLDQFFATNMPLQILQEHKQLIYTLAPAVSKAMLKRAVLVPHLDKMSDSMAYIDSVGRATYTIAVLQHLDPSTGRKLSYILPETLATFPAAYLFARTAAPLRDCIAVHLSWMRAFGYVQLTDRLNNNLLDAAKRHVIISKQLVQVEHMVPLIGFLALGWTISVVVFFGERFVHTIGTRIHLREA